MKPLLDHIDLRVPDLGKVAAFYGTLLPAIGFVRRCAIEGWLQYEAVGPGTTAFFGVTASASHVPNENRIAFGAATRDDVDRLAAVARGAGAQAIEGPMDYAPGYYAVFFEDPAGNRLEICCRTRE